MNSPYFFASIADEYRRADFVDSRDLHPPLPDESTCAAEIDTPIEVPVEYPGGEWLWAVMVVLAVVAVSYLIDHPIALP